MQGKMEKRKIGKVALSGMALGDMEGKQQRYVAKQAIDSPDAQSPELRYRIAFENCLRITAPKNRSDTISDV